MDIRKQKYKNHLEILMKKTLLGGRENVMSDFNAASTKMKTQNSKKPRGNMTAIYRECNMLFMTFPEQ